MNGAPCRICPGVHCLEDSHVTVTPMTRVERKWSLDLESHQDFLTFREMCRLTTLSSGLELMMKWVSLPGIAPGSARYQRAALLLSYGEYGEMMSYEIIDNSSLELVPPRGIAPR